MHISQSNSEVGFNQSAPISRIAKMFKGALGIITADGIFTDAAINARQCRVDGPQACIIPRFRQFTQSRLEEGNRFGVIACVVIGETYLHPQSAIRFFIELGARFGRFIHSDGRQGFAIMTLHLKRY